MQTPARRTGRRLGVTLSAALAALVVLAAPAFAHVNVSTNNPSAGGFAV